MNQTLVSSQCHLSSATLEDSNWKRTANGTRSVLSFTSSSARTGSQHSSVRRNRPTSPRETSQMTFSGSTTSPTSRLTRKRRRGGGTSCESAPWRTGSTGISCSKPWPSSSAWWKSRPSPALTGSRCYLRSSSMSLRVMSDPVVAARDLARVPGRRRKAAGVEGLGRGFDMRFYKGEEVYWFWKYPLLTKAPRC